MNFLSIDCSTEQSFLFLKQANKTYIKNLQRSKYNNDILMKEILDFLNECNATLKSISSIFVNQGPGSFSGVRSSIATAKGIILANNLKLYGYNTFILSGVGFYDERYPIYCILKVRDKYYLQKFKNNLNEQISPKQVTLNIIKKINKNNLKIIANIFSEKIDAELLKTNNLKIVSLDYEKLEFLVKKELLEKKNIKPVYLS